MKTDRPWLAALLLSGCLATTTTAAALYDVVLGRPTDSAVAVSVMPAPDTALQVYVAYGSDSGALSTQTAPQDIAAGAAATRELTPLQPDTQYYYRVFAKRPEDSAFQPGAVQPFHTARAPGSSFTFDVQADSHYGDPVSNQLAVYQATAANIAADQADFLIDLGDTFMTEKYNISTESGIWATVQAARRSEFSLVGASTPMLLATGNHESELGWLLSATAPTANPAVWATAAREACFPAPQPGTFYAGSSVTDPYLQAPRNSYYAFTWGNAQCIVLDPYWYTRPKPGITDGGWGWTLGQTQYAWLRQTLAASQAQFKFVFLHHLVGGDYDNQARGGLEFARYAEWGGYNQDGSWGFDTQRPGWPMPIQDLLLSYKVSVVFHGHDHFFAKQSLDADGDGRTDLVYLECPQPASPGYSGANNATSFGYLTGDMFNSSGHIRVRVTPTQATIDYVRAYAPADTSATRVNGSVAHSFTLTPGTTQAATFPGTLVPGRPTDTALTANIVANTSLTAYLDYGTVSGVYAASTPVTSLAADQPQELLLTPLQPDTRYYYRVRFKPAGGALFLAAGERTFHTQRAPGRTFTFDLQSDPHLYDKKGNAALYQIAVNNMLADTPDFLLDLGDTFGDDHNPTTITATQMTQLHLNYRGYFDTIGGVAPLFLCIGNHEGETIGYESPDSSANPICSYATQARLRTYPNPFPNAFYSGNTLPDAYVNASHEPGLPANYYAWEWGDALFVVLDAYRYLPSAKPANLWDWTLGKAQYDWFKHTLETSTAKYKFVFAHHVLGQTRGGIAWAGLYEWGGKNADGSWGFAAKRPGWDLPLHQLMVANGVTIFFQGHDHLFAREELDGLIYQECPMPSDATYTVGDVNADSYQGDVLQNSGHLRVTVAPAAVTVDYVRAYLPADATAAHPNGELAFTYSRAGANRPPNVAAAAFTVPEAAAPATVVGTVSASDPDAGDTLTYAITAGNTGGVFAIDGATGRITLADGSGLDHAATPVYSLTVRVTDTAGLAANATITVTVTVAAGNQVPEAAADVYAVPATATLTVAPPGVLGNDSDPEGDALSVRRLTEALHGTVTLSAAGGFTYTPTAGYAGPDSFTYTANDGLNDGAPATVSLLVYDGWLMSLSGGATAGQLQFGVTSGATDGVDLGIDLMAASGASLSLLGVDSAQTVLRRDLRGSGTGAEWFMVVRSTDSPITLTWDRATVPASGLRLQELAADGALVAGTEIDMTLVGERVVAANTTAAFRIGSSLITCTLDLAAGWNLVSLPIQPFNPAVDAVLSAANLAATRDSASFRDGRRGTISSGTVWAWEPGTGTGGGAYHSATEFEPLVGYWVYVSEAVTLVVSGTAAAESQVHLSAGWNLIGVTAATTLQSIAGVFTPGYGWDPVQHVYTTVRNGETLAPGRGYWIYASTDVELNSAR